MPATLSRAPSRTFTDYDSDDETAVNGSRETITLDGYGYKASVAGPSTAGEESIGKGVDDAVR
jgi:hypothetical protein